MNQATISTRSNSESVRSIKQAATDYDWPRVVELTSQLLEGADLPPETAVDVLRHRARAHEYMGHIGDASADLETAVSLAAAASLSRRHIMSLNQLCSAKAVTGQEGAGGLQAATDALALTQQIGSQDLEAECQLHIAMAYFQLLDYRQQQQHGQIALSLAQKSGNRLVEAGSYLTLALAAAHESNWANFDDLIQNAEFLCQQLGDRPTLTRVHLYAGWFGRDSAANHYHKEQAYHLAREINHLFLQIMTGNNLAVTYWEYGLYHLALQMAEAVAPVARTVDHPIHAVTLGTLSEIYLELGRYERIPPILSEMEALGRKSSNIQDPYPTLLSGLAELGRGHTQAAVHELQTAANNAAEERSLSFQSSALAWLGAAELANGDAVTANRHTAAAISLYETGSFYAMQEIYWWHYKTS